MAVTVAAITKNLCMSRHSKDGLVAYRIRKQPLPCITHLMPLKPDQSSVCLVCLDSVQHLVLTSKSHSYQSVHRNRLYE
jgi:hypothetical protein